MRVFARSARFVKDRTGRYVPKVAKRLTPNCVSCYPPWFTRGATVKLLGFNSSKGRLAYCLVEGPRSSAKLVDYGHEKFDAEQAAPEMANYFKQTFSEIIGRYKPDGLSYRMSLEGKKDSIPYLYFSFGVLNLVAHEMSLPVYPTISNTFTSKALGVKGDKFTVCDQLINPPKTKWDNHHRYAALSALVSLDA